MKFAAVRSGLHLLVARACSVTTLHLVPCAAEDVENVQLAVYLAPDRRSSDGIHSH